MTTRRTFVLWLAVVGLAPLAVLRGCWGRNRRAQASRLLATLLPDRVGLSAGRTLVGHSEERARRLAALLLRHAPLAPKGDAALREWYSDRVVSDFEAGRTLEIDGWQVSEAEAGLFALKVLRFEPESKPESQLESQPEPRAVERSEPVRRGGRVANR